jgi:CBS domain-containing protein
MNLTSRPVPNIHAEKAGESTMLDEAIFTAADLMSRDVAVVHPETTLLEAVRIMAERRISGVPVVDDRGVLVGMLSEGDLLRWHEGHNVKQARWLEMLAEGADLSNAFLSLMRDQRRQVQNLMAPGAVTVTEDAPAREIANLMYTRGIKRVPVLRDGKLVGIVARSDLVRALAQKLDEAPKPLPAEPPHSINEALRRGREQSKH